MPVISDEREIKKKAGAQEKFRCAVRVRTPTIVSASFSVQSQKDS